RAATLPAELGEPRLDAEDQLGDAGVLVFAGDETGLAAAVGHLRDAVRLFRETGDRGGEIEAGVLGLEGLWGAGRLTDLIAEGEQLLRQAREIGDAARELQTCSRLVPAWGLTGSATLADHYQSVTEELITRLGARVPPWTRVSRCGRLRAIGDLDAADSCYAELLAVGRAEGDPLLEIASCRNRAEVLLDRRRYAE